jgi:hypothetical protein
MRKSKWTFLTNHGRVLAYISRNPQKTTEKIAREARISLRTVQKIIADLEEEGYITRQKQGRCNVYKINPDRPMRHRLERDHTVGDILQPLGYSPSKGELSDSKDSLPLPPSSP